MSVWCTSKKVTEIKICMCNSSEARPKSETENEAETETEVQKGKAKENETETESELESTTTESKSESESESVSKSESESNRSSGRKGLWSGKWTTCCGGKNWDWNWVQQLSPPLPQQLQSACCWSTQNSQLEAAFCINFTRCQTAIEGERERVRETARDLCCELAWQAKLKERERERAVRAIPTTLTTSSASSATKA